MEHDAPQERPDTARPTLDEITERTDALLNCITDRAGLLRRASDAAGDMIYAASEALYGGEERDMVASAQVVAFTDEVRTALARLRAQAITETQRRRRRLNAAAAIAEIRAELGSEAAALADADESLTEAQDAIESARARLLTRLATVVRQPRARQDTP